MKIINLVKVPIKKAGNYFKIFSYSKSDSDDNEEENNTKFKEITNSKLSSPIAKHD